MFNPKVFFHPDGIGGGSTLPAVDTSVTDRDILNGDDNESPIQTLRKPTGSGKGKGQVQETEEGDEEGIGDDEEDETDDSESDGTDSETESDEESVDEDDEDEDEEDDEEPEDDDDEVDAQGNLFKSLKKNYPDIFKKVPGLRDIIERDRQMGEVFTTPEEAASAARDSAYLSAMYKDIASGDVERTGNFLKALKNTDSAAFEDFAHTILDSVGKMDANLYGAMLLKPMKKAIMSMYADATRTGNKNLAAVAIHAHNYWFDTQDIKAPLEERKKPEKPKEQEAWEKEKAAYEASKQQEFMSGVTEVVNHSMKLSITKELANLKLDDYQKRNIIRDIFAGVDETLGGDKRYLASIQSLIDQSRTGKFSGDYKTKIVKAYLQRARRELPIVRNKVLKEAGIKVAEGAKKDQTRRLVPAGLGGSNGDTGIDWKRVDRTKTTDMDILNGKPKYIK